jgi:hypothetical protein
MSRLFTQDELKSMGRYRPELFRELVDEGDFAKAREVFESQYKALCFLHDGAFTWISGLMTWIYEHKGITGLEEAGRLTVELERQDALPESPQPDFDAIVKTAVRELRGINHQNITLSEDDEKLIIELAPCGNGGRLTEMAYDPDAGLARIEGPSPLTFGESELPSYCAGCALREIRDVDELGRIRVVHAEESTKPPKTANCRLLIYKDPDDIPEKYYRRLGLEKPPAALFPLYKAARVFSDEELTALAANPEDVVRAALDARDAARAKADFDRYYEEKTYMHDAVGCAVGALLTWVYDHYGLSGVQDAELFAHRIEGEVAMPHMPDADMRSLVLDTTSTLHGHVHQYMEVEEDYEKILIRVNPCGSGGRMIDRAFYPNKDFALLKNDGTEASHTIWGMDELPVYCVHCPVLEMLTFDMSGGFKFAHSFKTTTAPKSHSCEYVLYKNPEDTPEEYYTRIGRVKPV